MPKPLKVPSLARSVPKPLKVPSLARSVTKPLKVVDFFLRFIRFSLRCGSPSICSRSFSALRGPRREPTCIDGWDGWMDGMDGMDGMGWMGWDGLVRTCFCFTYFSKTT